ncbi:unnamed protein product (macronuclear) [Paramecium tetraurelia]|uniref:Uncharacterized protein n=1 Tax=Paramecium tetraurelia TaxID=5888 RepID=A0BMY8_PARTE|nr:uncharacterized protein GSPATT00030542001 [Paramecium tetraurelia]CAK59905.1 unnamed protein product [Paramecium tetraurelia]|eukprot:XP_001427303.1 hypothetical protein (macronuclear) [Paramecium tetraurelia strain d4-2]
MKMIFETHSFRQIVCELLDNCYEVLKAFLEQAIQNDEAFEESKTQINRDLNNAIKVFIEIMVIQRVNQQQFKIFEESFIRGDAFQEQLGSLQGFFLLKKFIGFYLNSIFRIADSIC